MSTKLIPIAISSQLDVTGEERIHAATINNEESTRSTWLGLQGDVGDLWHVGDVVSYDYAIVGGVPPYSNANISVGALPPSWVLDDSDMANNVLTVSGPTSTIGDYTWTLEVQDSLATEASLQDSTVVTNPHVLMHDDGGLKGARSALVTSGTAGLPDVATESVPQYAVNGILLLRPNSGGWNVYKYNLDTSVFDELVITGTKHGDYATISRDSNYIVSVNASAGTFSYYVYAWNGTGYTLVNGPYNTAYAFSGGEIKFSPDGTKVAHISSLSQVFIHPFNAGVLTIGSGKVIEASNIAWSPDSRYLAAIYSRPVPDNGACLVFDTEGAKPTIGSTIPAGSGNRFALDWGQNGIYCSGDYNANSRNFFHLSFDSSSGPALVSRISTPGLLASTLKVSRDSSFIVMQPYDIAQTRVYSLDSDGVPTLSQLFTTAGRSAWWVNHDI